MRGRRLIVGLVVLVLVLAAGGVAWAKSRSGGAAETATALATAITGTMRQTVSASGTISPRDQAALSFGVAGTVTSVAAQVGDQVEKGDELARIGTDALRADLTAAKAQVTAALAQLSENSDAGASDAQLAADEASLRSARSQRTAARTALDDAVLRATFDGTVASVDVGVGDTVGGSIGNGSTGDTGADSGTGSTVGSITVLSPDRFVVDASVAAADLASLKKGLQAEVKPTGSQQTVFGTVSSVGLVAESSTSGASTFPVTIAVTGKVTDAYAGSSADVTIVVKQLPDVLTVPTAAVTTGQDGATTVTVSTGKKTTVRPVTVGEVFGGQTQITKGLAEGDQVVVAMFRVPRDAGGGLDGNGQAPVFDQEGGGPPGGFPDGGFPGSGTSVGPR